MVHEGDNHIPIKQKPLTGVAVRHIRKLVRRDIELFGKDLPVAARLIEQVEEIAVFKDIFDLAGGQQVVG